VKNGTSVLEQKDNRINATGIDEYLQTEWILISRDCKKENAETLDAKENEKSEKRCRALKKRGFW